MYPPENSYEFPYDAMVFRDSLRQNYPYIAKEPRNHESLFVVTNGTLLYEKQGVRETVQAGEVGYIARGSTDSSGAFDCPQVSFISINFHFTRNPGTPALTLPFPTRCASDYQNRYEKLFSQALRHYSSKRPGCALICGGIVMQIIGMLLEEHRAGQEDPLLHQQIDRAVAFLKDNASDPELRIADAAALLDMSEKTFRRKFSAVYAQTPYAFLQEFRIEKARYLLDNTTSPLWDIAQRCGFSDGYSFSHCFRSHVGVSPSKYREEHPLTRLLNREKQHP